MARTTLNIADPILRELKRLQEEEGKTVGELASQLIAEALTQRGRRTTKKKLRWEAKNLQPRVDLADKSAVWDVLDNTPRRRR